MSSSNPLPGEALTLLEELKDCAEDILRADQTTIDQNLRALVLLQRKAGFFQGVLAGERKRVQFESWWAAVKVSSDQGMGCGELRWPDSKLEKLALQTILLERLVDDQIRLRDFGYDFFYANDYDAVIAKFVDQFMRPYLRDYSKLAEAKAGVRAKPAASALPGPERTLDVFISHSSKDVGLAKVLIQLLIRALGLASERIRCTSVPGFKLEAGAPTDARIRAEVMGSGVLIGLLTPASLASSYVLFELGARWGLDLYLAPLLAKGAKAGFLRGPISGVNALQADQEADLRQFVRNVAGKLGRPAPDLAKCETLIHRIAAISREGDAFVRFDGCRVKGRGAHRRDQYFVTQRKAHPLTEEAVRFCDQAGVKVDEVDAETEALLLSSEGGQFEGAKVKALLVEAGQWKPAPFVFGVVKRRRRSEFDGL